MDITIDLYFYEVKYRHEYITIKHDSDCIDLRVLIAIINAYAKHMQYMATIFIKSGNKSNHLEIENGTLDDVYNIKEIMMHGGRLYE